MPLLVTNAEIVNADSRYTADILCEGDTITRIDRGIVAPAGAEVIDAAGRPVFPGFIDPHTHIYLPFMGTFSKDDYETGTKAAVVGGTTTLFEMPAPRDVARRGLRPLARAGRGEGLLRLFLPHGRDPVRRRLDGPAPRDRGGRGGQLQGVPGLQGGLRRG
jgi:imidazolonepropionase-like amidohydrolase